LDIEKKKLNDAKLKQSLGIETSIDIQSSELTIQKDQNSLTTSQNQLKDTEYTFKLLTGKDVTQYNLEKDIKFEPLKIDGSLDDYLDNVVESDLKYSEELLKISKDYYDKDYESDNSITSSDIDNAKTAADSATKPTAPSASDLQADPTAYEKYQDQLTSYTNTKSKYTNLLTARLSYLKVKLSNYSNDVSIQETKKQLKEALRSYYTNLQTYEDSINYYKKEIDLYNAQLSNYKLKYDLGMMTESDYNTQVVSTLQAEIDLRNAIVSYNQNKEYIQKPWIASSSK
jgi:outer membrane protein TolC